jgi:hypothetical protein
MIHHNKRNKKYLIYQHILDKDVFNQYKNYLLIKVLLLVKIL